LVSLRASVGVARLLSVSANPKLERDERQRMEDVAMLLGDPRQDLVPLRFWGGSKKCLSNLGVISAQRRQDPVRAPCGGEPPTTGRARVARRGSMGHFILISMS
jgi:hypothetical protein